LFFLLGGTGVWHQGPHICKVGTLLLGPHL
jgi:hypothetical protein